MISLITFLVGTIPITLIAFLLISLSFIAEKVGKKEYQNSWFFTGAVILFLNMLTFFGYFYLYQRQS